MSKYLSSIDGAPAFKSSDINNILDTDRKLDDYIYTQYAESIVLGRMYKVKDINGATFEEIFEEYTLPPMVIPPTDNEIIAQTITEMQIDLTNQMQTLSSTIADMQLNGGI